jgi:hypothetical protein
MTTFVTSIFKLNHSNINDERKSIEKRIQYFEEIVKYGIKISIICCPYYEVMLEPLVQQYNNIKIIKVMNLSDTVIHQVCDVYESKHGPLKLPHHRNEGKDTREYMILMNSKLEFMKIAIDFNIWNSSYFCWIDFSIYYIVSNQQLCKENLLKISQYKMPLYQNDKMNIIIPGCTDRRNIIHTENIDWRFCGGIVFGYKHDLIDFYDMNCFYFKQFLHQYKTLVWEVNLWSWLEFIEVLHPHWTYGDHNDTIFMIVH